MTRTHPSAIPSHPALSARRSALGAATGLAAAALVLAAPLAAGAHVHVTPSSTEAGSTSELAFSFSHGCDGSPTTAVEVTVPEEIASVALIANAGWQVEADVDDAGSRTVSFTADTPVPDGVRETLELEVALPEEVAEGDTLVFPTLQTCEAGEWMWGDEDQASETPAPVLIVGQTTSAGGHDHGAEEAASDAAEQEDPAAAAHDHGAAEEATDAAAAPAEETAASPAVPVSIAALIVAVLAAVLGAAALRRQAQQR